MNTTITGIFCLILWLIFPTGSAHSAKKYQHAPFAEQECDSCHSSADPGKNDLTSAAPQLCYECHDEYTGEYFHSPTSVGACLFCHNAHESDNPVLLNEKESVLCYQCHDGLEEQINNRQNNIHEPAVDNCSACHDPHVSDISSTLLKKKMKNLCVECHVEEGIEMSVDINAVTHKHKPIESERSCGNCHDPHASPIEAYLNGEPMDLCLQCHGEEITIATGESLANIAQQLRDNQYHHGPIKEKNCSGCHSPHGSDYFRILLAQYTSEFYTKGYQRDYFALCFTCHDAAAMEEHETTTLTNFRNGKKNLHYLHVNRAKGRTCKTCHEAHASKQPKHIRDAVPYGKVKWPLELQYRFEYSNVNTGEPCTTPEDSCEQSGGSCVACHARKSYDYSKK